MKRALAERAKQSGLPNGSGPSMPSSETTTTSSPPHFSPPEHSSTELHGEETGHTIPSNDNNNDEISKNPLSIATKSNGPSLSSSSAPSPRTAPSPRPKKRLRDSVVKLDDQDEDDSNASAFYLRQQNRALASELRQLKYQIIRLERERDTRRSQCTLAVQNLNTLQATWSQLEDALKQDGPSGGAAAHSNDHQTSREGSSSTSAPLSTGSGTSVELVGALFHSLAELGTGTDRRRIHSENGDEMDVDVDDDDTDKETQHLEEPLPESVDDDTSEQFPTQQLDELLRITDNVAKRANALQGWIWSLLQKLEGGATEGVGVAEQVHAAQQQVAFLTAKNKTLKAKMKELARSRDELQESDRRVRRGLYRLAAGRIQLTEVLKAIVAADEDKEPPAAWIASSTTPAELGTDHTVVPNSTYGKTDEVTGDGKESTSITSAELTQLQKKVMELEQVANARDEQIKTVCIHSQIQVSFFSSHPYPSDISYFPLTAISAFS